MHLPVSRIQDGEAGRQVLAIGRDHVSGAEPTPRGRDGAGGALGRVGGLGFGRSLVADPEAAAACRGSLVRIEFDPEP